MPLPPAPKRLAGLFYLVVAIRGGLGETIRNAVDAPGDASALVRAIAAHATLPMGYLAYASRLFPRALGVLLVIGCFGYLGDTFTRLLAPPLGATLSPFFITPSAIAELAMVLWLLVMGVRAPAAGAAPTAA